MNFVIGHLYPEHLNLYGDRGNILTLYQRATWRGISATVKSFSLTDNESSNWEALNECHLLFMGGGQDAQQYSVAEHLATKKEALTNIINAGCVILGICGGYQLMGNYYQPAEGARLTGLELLDFYTIAGNTRMIGNVSIQRPGGSTVVGFENHSGKTYLSNDLSPLGTTIHGYGNNGEDQTEGVHVGNIYGSYLHGSLLPKNPILADELILKALNYAGYKLNLLPDFQDNTIDGLANIAHKTALNLSKQR